MAVLHFFYSFAGTFLPKRKTSKKFPTSSIFRPCQLRDHRGKGGVLPQTAL